MADISKITLPNGSEYDIKDSAASHNLVDGSAIGSVRGLYTAAENNNYTIGNYAFSEGYNTTASGNYSHAQNIGTIASGSSQTALGKYNIEDTNEIYSVIIGNGTKYTPSNALTVDWYGDTTMAGQLYLKDWGGTVNNNYSCIAAYATQSDPTTSNIYYVANGYHAFYTGNTGYEDDEGNPVTENGHAIPTATPFYIFNDNIRATVPIDLKKGFLSSSVSDVFVDAESSWIGYTGSYAASGTSNDSIKEGTATVSKANCYPVALSGFQTKTRMLVPIRVTITNRQVGTCTIGYSIANRHTSSISVSDGSLKVWITWVRCS